MSIVRPSAPQPARAEPASSHRPATPPAKPPSFAPPAARKESPYSPGRSHANGAPRRESNRTPARDAASRETPSNRQDDDNHAACIPSSPEWRHNDGGDRQQSGEQEGKDVCGTVASAHEAAFDAAALADDLAPLGGNDGIFEIILPSGAVLGVAVSTQASGVRFLLSTPASGLAKQLRRQRMELEGRLERRMGRHVMLTVL
jgi:hypothetical protein